MLLIKVHIKTYIYSADSLADEPNKWLNVIFGRLTKSLRKDKATVRA